MSDLYRPVDLINVGLRFDTNLIKVGRLAARDQKIYFQYLPEFLATNLQISPFKLPLKEGVPSFDIGHFENLPGVFHDSLPDGWGRLILDRALRARGINPDQLNPLDRLAHVGQFGMGALVYTPDYTDQRDRQNILDLDHLSTQSTLVLNDTPGIVLDELLGLNGSSGGARPKAMIGVNADKSQIIHGVDDLSDEFEHWLVKFPTNNDGPDSGAIEYVYAQMAREAGIEMTETYLFPSKASAGFFATKRFDRQKNNRLHLHTAAGLVHANFRSPSLDYEDLITLTMNLTRDITQAEKMFRLAVFNVLGHNRDDHGKNFSYLMDENGRWQLSPAYDLIYSSGPGGEQSTMVMREGRNPGIQHLLELAKTASIPDKKAQEIIGDCRSALSQWKAMAKNAGVKSQKIDEIDSLLQN